MLLHRLRPWIATLAAGLLAVLSLGTAWADEEFLPPERAFSFSAEQRPGEPENLRLHWHIAPGYYLYRSRIEVVAKDGRSKAEINLPAGTSKDDPTFGPMEIYKHEVEAGAQTHDATSVEVIWQGCAEAGVCYPPQRQVVPIVNAPSNRGESGQGGVLAEVAAANSRLSPKGTLTDHLTAASNSDTEVTRLLSGHSLGWSVGLFLLLGIGLAFTPCVLPMLPILSSIVVRTESTPLRSLALSGVFALTMALTYALVGAGTAMAGSNLQLYIQSPAVVVAIAMLFVVLAAAMAGFFTLQLPEAIRSRIDQASQHGGGGTLYGAAVLGLLSAVMVGPCMTAPLAGTLIYMAQTGDVVVGATLLFSLGVGMGLPLVVFTTLGSRWLPKPGAWMERVKVGFALLLLGMAVWTLQKVVTPGLGLGLWGVFLLLVCTTLQQVGRTANDQVRVVCRSGALGIGVWGASLILGAAAGGTDFWRPLVHLARSEASVGSAAVLEQKAGALRFQKVGTKQELQAAIDEASKSGRIALLDFTRRLVHLVPCGRP